jgi:predicted aconitase with swiveling domain
MGTRFNGKKLSGGFGRGPLLISVEPISFFGGVDPKSGLIIDRWHSLHNKSLKGVVLAVPRGKGSTVGSYVIYALSKNNVAPAALVLRERDIVIAAGCILGKIPSIELEVSKWAQLSNHSCATVNGYEGYIEVD